MAAYTLLLEIDDITRFPSVRQFHSYCRLVPGAENSAATRRHKRLRDRNRYLKLALHQAAVRAAQYYPEIQTEYRRLVRRKGKAIARALIAKDLGAIVYHVLNRQEAFNGRFRGLSSPVDPHETPAVAPAWQARPPNWGL
jgi:transposase